MKKVLILAYDFPPLNTIGAQRPYSWFKYFKENGIHPIVITKNWDKTEKDEINSTVENNEFGTLIKVTYPPNLRDKIILKYGLNKLIIIRKFLSLFYSVFQYFNFQIDTKSALYNKANSYLRKEKVDYIIATGEPFILFSYAKKLSKTHKTPWVADYRDGWSTNNRYSYNPNPFLKLESLFLKIIEKRTVIHAKNIITTSYHLKNQLAKLLNKPVSIIYNGFYDELINQIPKEKIKTKELKISYSGTIYSFQRLEIFLKGYQQFLKKNPTSKIKITFYGIDIIPESKARINSFNISDKHLELKNKIPQSELLYELYNSDILLLLTNETIDQLYAKTFEYLALKKMTWVVVNDNGSIESIIKDTNAGLFSNTSIEVEQQLNLFYKEWLEFGKIKCHSKNYEVYNRKIQSKKLIDLLNV